MSDTTPGDGAGAIDQSDAPGPAEAAPATTETTTETTSETTSESTSTAPAEAPVETGAPQQPDATSPDAAPADGDGA